MESNLNQNYAKLQEVYNNYINKHTPPIPKEANKYIVKLKGLLQEQQHLEIEANRFIEENQYKWNFPTPEIIKWINQVESNGHAFNFKKKIRESNGLITNITVHRIFEPQFMQTVIGEVVKKIHKVGYIEKIFTTQSRDIRLVIFFNKKRLTVQYNYSDFIKNLGVDLLYDQPIEINFEDFIMDAKYDIQSYEEMLEYLIYNCGEKFIKVENNKTVDDIIYFYQQKYYFFNTSSLNQNLILCYFKEKVSKNEALDVILSSSYKVLSKEKYELEKELGYEVTNKMK